MRTNNSICSPFVEIEVIDGSQSSVFRTRTITSNGLNPVWFEHFQFTVTRPELSFLRFVVEDGDFLGPKIDPFLGQSTFPIDCLRPGYRSVPLLNNFSEQIELSALLVHLEIRTLDGNQKLNNMHSFLRSILSPTKCRFDDLPIFPSDNLEEVGSQSHGKSTAHRNEGSNGDTSQVRKSMSLKRLLRISK